MSNNREASNGCCKNYAAISDCCSGSLFSGLWLAGDNAVEYSAGYRSCASEKLPIPIKEPAGDSLLGHPGDFNELLEQYRSDISHMAAEMRIQGLKASKIHGNAREDGEELKLIAGEIIALQKRMAARREAIRSDLEFHRA